MNLFYILSSVAMIVLLGIATVIVSVGRKIGGGWWLVAFLGSLVVNTGWAIVAPILSGLDGMSAPLGMGNCVVRLVSLAGYGALLGFVLARKRSLIDPK
jgi:hypothetical protein